MRVESQTEPSDNRITETPLPPLISIIVPHFNRSVLVRETVASVEAQTRGDWELILVDDGSSSEERVALQALAGEKIRILDRTDGEKGPSRCRNLGAKQACGEFLVFLDSDDLLGSICLEQRFEAAQSAPDQDLWVFPTLEFCNHPGDLEKLWGIMRPGSDDAARFAQGDAPWHTSSPLWRRSAFLELGGFNERIFYGDDANLHLRAILTGLRIRQFAEAKPDTFVRRSEELRITNSLDEKLVRSRLVRLEEGTAMLRSVPSGRRFLPIWEGQHFVEAEFLLFHQQPRAPINAVLSLLEKDFTPKPWRRLLVRGYFAFSRLTRDRAFLLLRTARRLVMLNLPSEYFPNRG